MTDVRKKGGGIEGKIRLKKKEWDKRMMYCALSLCECKIGDTVAIVKIRK